jgi:PAS domain S-box-containing protein
MITTDARNLQFRGLTTLGADRTHARHAQQEGGTNGRIRVPSRREGTVRLSRGALADDSRDGLGGSILKLHLATSVRLLVALVAMISLILLGAHLVQMRIDHDREAREAQDDLMNVTAALARNTQQSFDSIDRGLVRFSAELDTGQPPGVLHEALRAARDSAPGVIEFFITDDSARVAAASYHASPEPADPSDEPPFMEPVTGEDLRISPPLTGTLGHASGMAVLRLARPHLTESRALKGWAVGTVSVDHFISQFAALRLTPHTRIALFREDGVVLASSDGDGEGALAPGSREALFRDHLRDKRPSGGLWVDNESGGRDLVVFSRVESMPLLVMAETPEDEVFAAWKLRALTGSIVYLVLIAFIVGATAIAIRALQLRQREQDDATSRLNQLAAASIDISSQGDSDGVLRRATDIARELVPSHQAVVSLTIDANFAQAVHTVSLSEKYARWRSYDESPDGTGIYRLVCLENRPLRMTQAELECHPDWKGFGAAKDRHPPMRGLLAVPLIAQDGSNLGLIELSDRVAGEYDERDEAVLVQLAQIVSASAEKVRLLEARTSALAAAEAARDEITRIFSTMSDGVYHLDRDWRYTSVNRAAEEMFGISESDVLGKSMWEAFPDLYGTEVFTRFHQAMESRQHVTFENYYPPLERFHQIRLFPAEDGLTVYASDVTERVRAEQQLRQAQKMEAVGQLTGGVAHDFNNLLTVIMGNADMLVEEIGPDDRLSTIAKMIQTAAERGADLTHRLLAFSRRQPLAPSVVDANQLITNLEGLLRRTLHESIDLELVRGAGLWKAVVDKSQLENAVLNIVINARDAMPEGGKLTIETANTRLDDAYAAGHEEVRPGQYVMVAVSDTGQGMDLVVLGRAFDPFFTTKPVGKGSGLGLSMVYGFVKQSGGHVKLYSEPGYGTTVKIYLPKALDKHATIKPEESPSQIARGSERIALVEDEDMVRKFAEMNLTSLGYKVAAFANGPDLLQAMDKGLAFDLLFTDIVLPGGMNGRDIAEAVTARAPGTKVLYSSGYTDNAIVHHGRLDEGVSLLNKPFRKAEMAQKVRAVLDGPTPEPTTRLT